MNHEIEIDEFLELSKQWPVFDVRTPFEYESGHVACAVNFPLMSNEERVMVGTIFKQSGKFSAVLKAYQLIGPKMSEILKCAHKMLPEKKAIIYCWRGGLRSESVCWLLHSAGFETLRLKGGYKAYRTHARQLFSDAKMLCVVGGMTGSGKTEILHELKKRGEQVLDLEGIAYHKGSAFGHIGMQAQTNNEQFENRLAEELCGFNLSQRIWIEDESKSIGKNNIPDEIWQQMHISPVFFIETEKNLRVKRLVNDYTIADKSILQAAIDKIAEKLGGDNTKKALQALVDNEFEQVAEISLSYYDKAYLHSLTKHNNENIYRISASTIDAQESAKILINHANTLGL